MTESANVRSLDAVRQFASSVLQFQEEARLCVTQLEMELRKMLGWIERERPGFWKREIEACHRRQAEARVMLHKCRMRRVGDFRPTCFQEKKHVQRCREDLEFAQEQIRVIKRWVILAHQEAEEYFGRSVRLVQVVERELPRLIALLRHSIERLEEYGDVQVPNAAVTGMRPAANPSGDRPPDADSADADGPSVDPVESETTAAPGQPKEPQQ